MELSFVKIGMTGVGGGIGRVGSPRASWCGCELSTSTQNGKHAVGWRTEEQLVLEH